MPRKILVVDDHQDARDMLKVLFTLRGFEVSLAVDGFDGVEKAKAIRPDLILTDFHMPNLNGVEMIEWVRQVPELKNTPVILLSADRDVERKAITGGANRFVKKPVPFDDLIRTIEQLFEMLILLSFTVGLGQ